MTDRMARLTLATMIFTLAGVSEVWEWAKGRPAWLRRVAPSSSLGAAVIVLVGMTGAWLLSPLPLCRIAHAQTYTSAQDYCYRSQITVTNSGGAVSTPMMIPVEFSAATLSSQSYIGVYGWDLRSTDAALVGVESEAHLDDGAGGLSNTARLWFQSATVPAGESTNYLFMGNNAVQSDFGLVFDGTSDTVTGATGVAAVQPSDNFTVRARANTTAEHATAGWIVSDFDAAGPSGYRMGTIDVTGTKYLRCQVDSTTVDVAWDGSDGFLECQYQDPTLTASHFDTSNALVASNTASESQPIGAAGAGVDWTVGEKFAGTIREAGLLTTTHTTPVWQLRWMFQPRELTETQEGNAGNGWVYLGTAEDSTTNPAQNRDGSYSLTRDTTGVTAAFGPVTTQFADASTTVSARIADIFGEGFETDLFGNQGPAGNLPFISAFNSAQSSSNVVANAFWILIVGFFSIAGSILVYRVAGFTWASVVPALGLLTASVQGLLPPYVFVLFVIMAVGTYFYQRVMQEA